MIGARSFKFPHLGVVQLRSKVGWKLVHQALIPVSRCYGDFVSLFENGLKQRRHVIEASIHGVHTRVTLDGIAIQTCKSCTDQGAGLPKCEYAGRTLVGFRRYGISLTKSATRPAGVLN